MWLMPFTVLQTRVWSMYESGLNGSLTSDMAFQMLGCTWNTQYLISVRDCHIHCHACPFSLCAVTLVILGCPVRLAPCMLFDTRLTWPLILQDPNSNSHLPRQKSNFISITCFIDASGINGSIMWLMPFTVLQTRVWSMYESGLNGSLTSDMAFQMLGCTWNTQYLISVRDCHIHCHACPFSLCAVTLVILGCPVRLAPCMLFDTRLTWPLIFRHSM